MAAESPLEGALPPHLLSQRHVASPWAALAALKIDPLQVALGLLHTPSDKPEAAFPVPEGFAVRQSEGVWADQAQSRWEDPANSEHSIPLESPLQFG